MVNKLKLALVLTLACCMLAVGIYADTIFIEAENGTDNSFPIESDSNAYGGKYIASAELEKSITYKFTITEAGKYLIWTRNFATNDVDNSMFYIIDGTGLENQENFVYDYYEPSEYEIAENRYTPDNFREPEAYYGHWYWMPMSYRDVNVDPAVRFNLKEFDLTAGEHTLVIMPREAGARLDKLIITNDMAYDPTKISIDPEEQWIIDNTVIEEAAPAPADEPAVPVVSDPTPVTVAPQTSDNIVVFLLVAFAGVTTAIAVKRKSVK